MAKQFRRKLLFITVFLVILLSYSAYVSLIPSVRAAEISTQEKGLLILSNVVGLDLTKYTVNTKEDPKDSYFGVVPQENVGYNLEYTESRLRLLCTFTGGTLHILHVLERDGSPRMTRTTTTALEMAKDFLSNYQRYSRNSFYGELGSMLDKVDANMNLTTIFGNIKLEVTNSGDYTTFSWTYTFNGVGATCKCVALGYKNGFLKHFIDTWDLYKIGSTSINLSEKEAIAIAMERAKTYSWKVIVGNDTFEVNNFKVTQAMVTQLVFCSSLNANKARSQDPLTLYPMWRIGIGLDKYYPGNVYGIYVDIWADTKEVRHVQEVFSTLPPPADKIATIDESAVGPLNGQAPNGEAQLNSISITWRALLAFAAIVLGTVPVWLRRKKNSSRSYRLPKLHYLRIGGVLLCLLISSTMLLVPISTVSADIRRATIWGSLAPPKTSTEVSLQDQICQYIHSKLYSSGYVSSDYQGSYTLKNNVLNSIESDEANYHRVATVWFDHGVGTTEAPGAPGEWHFMLCDSANNRVYDFEIYDKTWRGKTFFAFIGTCMSAKLDLINPLTGTPLGTGSYGANPGGYKVIGMPYAWTHGASLSTDGYANPDSGLFCYIGFPWGSAALALVVDPDYPSVRYYDWVWDFFKYALDYDMTVNQALDHASYECFPPQYFGSTDLHTGFTAYWPDVGYGPNSTMMVYGNGNIRLYHPGTEIASRSGSLSGSGATYTFSIPNLAGTYTVVMVGNELADFDLYAKWNSPPTRSSYDARSWTSYSSEYFTISGSGTLYIMVDSWSGSGNWRVNVVAGSPSASSGRKVGSLSGTGATATYSLAGSGRAWVYLAGPDGSDFDLYLKWNSPPTTTSYDARGYSGWAHEIVTCTGSGTLYYMVHSYSGSGEYTMLAFIF